MGVNAILRTAKRATKLLEEHNVACEKIKIELEKITGIDCLSVCSLPGDGLGVCLEEKDNCDSAGLSDVLSVIKKNGTITRQEIIDLTGF